jgi:hypothetical protein
VTSKPAGPGSLPIRSTRASYGPFEPSGVEIPFAPLQTSWSGITNGISVTVTIDKVFPPTGQAVGFDVEMSSPDHVCCGLILWFGDGGGYEKDNGFACPGPTGHGPVHYHTTHTYNLEGRWTFVVYPVSGNCVELGASASLFGAIEVHAGRTTAQGPTPPEVTFDSTVPPAGHEGDPTWLSVTGLAHDPDGFLRTFMVDWGDGSAPEVLARDVSPCVDDQVGWPQPNWFAIFTGQAFHHYSAHGTYTVTATAVSTACDGSTPQQGSAGFTWRA